MDTSYETDSDQDDVSNDQLDSMISEAEAKNNYEEAGRLVKEETDQISLDSHLHLIDSTADNILNEVLLDKALSFSLSDFQRLSLNTLLQKKDLILLSPTGSGKEC